MDIEKYVTFFDEGENDISQFIEKNFVELFEEIRENLISIEKDSKILNSKNKSVFEIALFIYDSIKSINEEKRKFNKLKKEIDLLNSVDIKDLEILFLELEDRIVSLIMNYKNKEEICDIIIFIFKNHLQQWNRDILNNEKAFKSDEIIKTNIFKNINQIKGKIEKDQMVINYLMNALKNDRKFIKRLLRMQRISVLPIQYANNILKNFSKFNEYLKNKDELNFVKLCKMISSQVNNPEYKKSIFFYNAQLISNNFKLNKLILVNGIGNQAQILMNPLIDSLNIFIDLFDNYINNNVNDLLTYDIIVDSYFKLMKKFLVFTEKGELRNEIFINSNKNIYYFYENKLTKKELEKKIKCISIFDFRIIDRFKQLKNEIMVFALEVHLNEKLYIINDIKKILG